LLRRAAGGAAIGVGATIATGAAGGDGAGAGAAGVLPLLGTTRSHPPLASERAVVAGMGITSGFFSGGAHGSAEGSGLIRPL